MASTKKKAAKKKVVKKIPVNPLDKKILKAVASGKNRLEKLTMAITAYGSEITTRLNFLKRQGKVAFTSKLGWHIPAPSYVPSATAIAGNSNPAPFEGDSTPVSE